MVEEVARGWRYVPCGLRPGETEDPEKENLPGENSENYGNLK
jgi:hypothetical protein